MIKNDLMKEALSLDAVWCAVLVYNNEATIREVALGCRKHLQRVLVVDDGSTDTNVAELFVGTDISVVRHASNRGKGAALTTALEYVAAHGEELLCLPLMRMASIIPMIFLFFIEDLQENMILIGCRDFTVADVPESSKFGRKFSNFWFRIETGLASMIHKADFVSIPLNI